MTKKKIQTVQTRELFKNAVFCSGQVFSSFEKFDHIQIFSHYENAGPAQICILLFKNSPVNKGESTSFVW